MNYTEELRGFLGGGDNLISLVEYNNGGEIKYFAICKTLNINILDKLKWLKKMPIVFTKEEIEKAISIFPVELLDIKKHHKLLFGEDLFNKIQISDKDLSTQLKFEFRSKLIHLRQAYLSSKHKDLDYVIISAVPILFPIIGALMHIKGRDENFNIGEFITIYGIDIKVLREILEVRKGKAKLKADKNYYIDGIINILTEVGKIVDST